MRVRAAGFWWGLAQGLLFLAGGAAFGLGWLAAIAKECEASAADVLIVFGAFALAFPLGALTYWALLAFVERSSSYRVAEAFAGLVVASLVISALYVASAWIAVANCPW